MTISLTPQHESLLNAVIQSGHFASAEEAIAEALRLLNTQTSGEGSRNQSILPPDEWLAEFDRITTSRRVGNPHMDDSRESIYGDRGL